MNYNININQRAIIEAGLDIDITDAAIITGIASMFASPKTKTMNEGGRIYFWVAASKLSSDLPLINLKKQAIVKRLSKLVQKGVIVRHSANASMGMSFYSGGENWDRIFRYNPSTEKQTECMTVHTPMYDGTHPPMYDGTHPPMYDGTHNPNTNNPNTNNPNKNMVEKKISDTHTLDLKKIEGGKERQSNPNSIDGQEKEKEKKVAPKKEKEPYGKVQFPAHLDTPEFREAWGEYKEYRKKGLSNNGKRFRFKDAKSETRKLKEIGGIYQSPSMAVEAVYRNIDNGWMGFWEKKQIHQAAKSNKGQPAPVGKQEEFDRLAKIQEEQGQAAMEKDFWGSMGL